MKTTNSIASYALPADKAVIASNIADWERAEARRCAGIARRREAVRAQSNTKAVRGLGQAFDRAGL